MKYQLNNLKNARFHLIFPLWKEREKDKRNKLIYILNISLLSKMFVIFNWKTLIRIFYNNKKKKRQCTYASSHKYGVDVFIKFFFCTNIDISCFLMDHFLKSVFDD